jgi:hypothetical protein
LIISAIALALDNDLLIERKKRQKNVDVYIVISQMTDIDLRGADLSCGIPKNITVAGIARRCASVGAVKEQVR